MPLYLMKHLGSDGERERLVEASNIQTARNHVAAGIIQGEIAKPADLFRLAKAGVELEKAGAAVAPEAVEEDGPTGSEGVGEGGPSAEELARLEAVADAAGAKAQAADEAKEEEELMPVAPPPSGRGKRGQAAE